MRNLRPHAFFHINLHSSRAGTNSLAFLHQISRIALFVSYFIIASFFLVILLYSCLTTAQVSIMRRTVNMIFLIKDKILQFGVLQISLYYKMFLFIFLLVQWNKVLSVTVEYSRVSEAYKRPHSYCSKRKWWTRI